MSEARFIEHDLRPRTNVAGRRTGLSATLVACLAAIGLIVAACSDDEPLPTSSAGSQITAARADPAESPEDPTTTETEPETTTAETEEPSAEVSPVSDYVVLVRGSLIGEDLVQAQQLHDTVAGGGEDAAKQAGDVGHRALLGTTLLGTTENAFLGLDQWNDLDGLAGFYCNPDVAEGFAGLFSGPPAIETFEWRQDWHQWGELDVGDQYWWVITRGRLAGPDDGAAQTAHDLVASGGEAPSVAAGDVAHIVFTGIEDPAEFLAIDVWLDPLNLETFYSDPDFAAAFATLFDGGPSIGVYASTDWHQW